MARSAVPPFPSSALTVAENAPAAVAVPVHDPLALSVNPVGMVSETVDQETASPSGSVPAIAAGAEPDVSEIEPAVEIVGAEFVSEIEKLRDAVPPFPSESVAENGNDCVVAATGGAETIDRTPPEDKDAQAGRPDADQPTTSPFGSLDVRVAIVPFA
jgi:hypothetical protein